MKLFRLPPIVSLLPLLLCFAGSAGAQDSSETSNNGGTFVWNIGSWTLGVPTVADTAYIFAGTVTVDGAVSTGRIRFTGGTLKGATNAASDSITLSGLSSNSLWSGGTIRELSVVISQSGALDISGSSTNALRGAILTIEQSDGTGLANWTSGQLQLNDVSIINNSGKFDDSASSLITTASGGIGTFNNLSNGEYNKTASGTTEIDVIFNNSGLVNVDAGTLILDGGGTNSVIGEIAADSGTAVNFHSDYTVADAAKLTGEGQYSAQAGTLTLDGVVSANNFSIDGGNLTGTHTFTNDATFSEGTLQNGSTTNDNDSTFTIYGDESVEFNNHTFTNVNQSFVEWSSGDILLNSGSVFTNSGDFNATSYSDVRITSSTGSRFENTSTGTVEVSTYEGTVEFQTTFNNQGTVDVTGGNLMLQGGGSSSGTFNVATNTGLFFNSDYSVNGTSRITGTGRTILSSGTLDLNTSVASPNFEIEGGTLTGSHTFANGATWTGGALSSGTTTNASGSVFNLEDASGNILNDHDILNQSGGTVNWKAGNIDARTGSVITNQGTFNDTADASFVTNSGSNGSFTNASTGTYNKNGSGVTTFTETFDNEGTVNVTNGTLILDGTGTTAAPGSFDVGTLSILKFDNNYTVANAASLTGSGKVEVTGGTLDIDGQISVPNLRVDGGILSGDHTLNSGATIANGSFSAGTTTNASGSALNLSDIGSNILNDRDIINQSGGTLNWTAGNIDARTGSTITNQGTFNDTADASFVTNSGSNGSFTNASTGTYNKNSSGVTTFTESFNNDGTVNVTNGTLILDGTGTTSASGSFDVGTIGVLKFDNNYTVADAAGLTGTGQVKVTDGTLDIDGQIGVSDLRVDGGALSGDHTFNAGATIADGSFAAGTTTNAGGSILNLSNVVTNILTDRDIINLAGGTINWTAGNIDARSTSTITNQGTFNDTADASFVTNSGTDGSFLNSFTGAYNKNGSGLTTFTETFDNDGTVNVNAGTLKLGGTGTNSATGSYAVATGATLLFDNNYSINDASKLTGTGAFKATNGTVNLFGSLGISDFRIEGATITGDQTFNHGATLQDGSFGAGTTTNASTSTLNLSDTIDNILTDRDIINLSGGVINWTSGNIDARSSSTITNQGTFNDTADGVFRTNSGTAGSFTNASTGIYNKNGAGASEFDKTFNNDGTVNVNSGTLKLDGTGVASSTGAFAVGSGATLQFDNNYTITNASLLTGTGVFKATAGTFDLNNQVQNVAIFIEGATLIGTHAFHQGATLTSGSFGAGETTVSNNSTLNLSASANLLTDRDIYIQSGSTLNWTTGNINANTGSFIFLQGTLNDTADAHFTSTSGTGEYLTLSGGSVYNKNGSGITEIDSTFNNFGTVNVNSGTLIIDGGGQASSAGAFDVDSGAILKFDSNYSVADASKLTGSGKYLLSANDLDLDGTLSVDFEQDGGDLDGSFQIGGTFDWEDGSWNADVVGESTTINSSSVLNMKDTTSFYNNRHITNNGTVNWSGGTMLSNSGGSFTNNGLFKDLSESDHNISESSGSSTFTNSGTFLKTGAGTTRIDQTFNNSSPTTLQVQNGVLVLNGGGTNFSSGSMVVENTGLIQFDDDYKIENAARLSVNSLSGTHGYELTDGALDLDGTLSVDFVQTGGELDGTHNIAGKYNWNGGSLSADSDGESTNIYSTGELNINLTSLNALFYNRDINNLGTVNWTDGNLISDAEGSFANNGMFNDKLDHDHIFSGAPSFSNTGTYTKSNVGITEFDSDFDNDGTVVVNAGTLKLDGGGLAGSMGTFDVGSTGTLQFDNDYSITEASNLTGAGKFLLSNGNLNLPGNLSVNFEQTGGNLSGSQIISGTFDLGGFGDWNATEDGATTQITSTGVLNISGNDKTYVNRDITNTGTVNWSDGDFRTNAAGSFDNKGTFNDQTIDSNDIEESAGSATFTNSGTFDKSGNSTTTIRQDFANTGNLKVHQGTLVLADDNSHSANSTIVIDSGAQITLSANTTLTNGVDISGAGTLQLSASTLSSGSEDTALLSAPLPISSASTADTLPEATTIGTRFEQTGGVLNGHFKFSNAFAMTGGSVAAHSAIDLIGNTISSIDLSSLSLDDTVLKVGSTSTLNWTRGNINTGDSGGLDIDGIFINTFDGSITQALAGDGTLNVSGQFRKTGGTGETFINLPSTISGRMEAHTGSVTFSNPGTSNSGLFDVWSGATMNFNNGFTFNNGTTVPNGGDFNLNGGTFSINDTVSLGEHASVTGGTLTGTHTLSGKVVVNGANFDSSGTTTIGVDSTLEFAHGEANLMPRSFVNKGTILWSAGGLNGSGGNSLTNDGEFSITTDGTFSSTADDFTLVNNGTIKKTSSTGTTTIDVPFTNNGLVTALTGNFHFTDTLTFGDGGKLGGGVQFDAPVTLPTNSTLQGNGTITGTIITAGKVSPGNSIGSLTVTGDLTLLSSSSTFIEVDASTTAGSADLVSVSGNLTLGGNLSWNLLSTLDPVTTSMFTLFTANNLSGSFANAAHGTRLSTASGQRSFIVNYGSGSSFDTNSVIFSSFEFTPVPEPSTWALMFTGLMIITWQSRRRRV